MQLTGQVKMLGGAPLGYYKGDMGNLKKDAWRAVCGLKTGLCPGLNYRF